MVRKMLVAMACMALVACQQPPPSSAGSEPPPSTEQAALHVAETAAQVADALHVAPPSQVVPVTIPAEPVAKAFRTFDAALSVIDALRDTRILVPGTPRALAVQKGIRTVQAALNAASAAQRASQATSYRDALTQAEAALSQLQTALQTVRTP